MISHNSGIVSQARGEQRRKAGVGVRETRVRGVGDGGEEVRETRVRGVGEREVMGG
jgi:hypothetical protein